MGEKTCKRKQLTVGEKIVEADKDRWVYNDLYEFRYWVIEHRDVHDSDEENERFRLFYAILYHCGMIQDYADFFCNGEIPLREFSLFYRKLVRIQNKRLREEKSNPVTVMKFIGFLAALAVLITAFIMCLPTEDRQVAIASMVLCVLLFCFYILAVWFKDSIKDE